MNRSVFREEALRRYSQARVEQVLPRLASPPVFQCLWAVAAMLVAGLIVCAWTEMPAYVSAPAIVVPWKGSARVIAFFPPDAIHHLRLNRPLWIGAQTSVEREKAAIVSVEPRVTSPAEAKQIFGLSAGTLADAAGPSVIAVAEWERAPAAVGRIYRAEVEIGSQSLLSILPVLRSLLGG